MAIGTCALLVAGAAWATGFYGEVIHIKQTSLLYDVGCGYQSPCIGVGTDSNPPGLVVNAVTRKVTRVPGTAYLSHIDCPKKNYCIAVGAGPSFRGGAIVQIHHGVPGSADEVRYYLDALACGTSSSCWVPGTQVNNGTGIAPVVLHLVDGKVVRVLGPDSRAKYRNYPYLFTAGEGGGALTCFGDHCIIAGKLSANGPGALFSLRNDKLTLLTRVSQMTAVAGLWCFSADLCRLTGAHRVGNASDGVFATFDKGRIEHVHIVGTYLGPIGCLVDMRCFAFGYEGAYPHNRSMVVKLNKTGKFVDSRVIEPGINGVFCSHTCIAAGSSGQYPNAGGVLFDKFVH
ncbi:MAG: hypothetical protein ACR2JH_03455 [Solirubrobacteraceae bacterium]